MKKLRFKLIAWLLRILTPKTKVIHLERVKLEAGKKLSSVHSHISTQYGPGIYVHYTDTHCRSFGYSNEEMQLFLTERALLEGMLK